MKYEIIQRVFNLMHAKRLTKFSARGHLNNLEKFSCQRKEPKNSLCLSLTLPKL